VVVLTLKLDSVLDSKVASIIAGDIESFKKDFDINFDKYELKDSLDKAFHFLDIVNKYVDENEPWKMIKDESKTDETKEVLYTVAESLRQV
jgi:methionyl-tRNA synthetase